MIYKRCGQCGKRLPSGTVCGCMKREYSEPKGIYKLYHTQRWQKLRAAVMSRCDGIDQWALGHHGRIEYAETVHHIIPTVDDETMFFRESNLIPVSRASHDEIHALYKIKKAATQEELKQIIAQKEAGGI